MVSIFIEGKEEGFLRSLMKSCGLEETLERTTFINIGGWTNLEKFENKFKDNHDSGIINLVLFDADTLVNGGGFDIRKRELEDLLNSWEVQFDIFLFPNNENDGDFEDMLEQIINPDHLRLLDCFENYENCVNQYTNDKGEAVYSLPAKKSKIYSYITAFPMSRKQTERLKNKHDWFFDNEDYWNLDHVYLANLRLFLLEET